MRAARALTGKIPKLTKEIESPLFNASVMAATVASKALPASSLVSSEPKAIVLISSFLLIVTAFVVFASCCSFFIEVELNLKAELNDFGHFVRCDA